MLERIWRKRNTPPLLVGLQTGTTTLKINLEFPQKLEIHIPEDPTISLLGIYLKDAPSCHRGTCSTMFIAATYVIYRSWKQTGCTTMQEWIQKIWFIYIMEYYSTIKNEDIMSFVCKWLERDNMILSKITQTKCVLAWYVCTH